MARKADKPKATAWDKLSSKKKNDKKKPSTNVYEDQQLDRSQIEAKKSKTSRIIVASIVGVLTAVLLWAILSLGQWGIAGVTGLMGGPASPDFVEREKISTTQYCYVITDESGVKLPDSPCYKSTQEAEANPPQWVQDEVAKQEAAAAEDAAKTPSTFLGWLFFFHWIKGLIALGAGLLVYGILYTVLMRNLDSQNLMNDTSDINQYQNDQHLAIPDEVVRDFDWFPDVGAHSSVQPNSLISHVMMSNKGLKKVDLAVRADENIYDDDGDTVYLKGEIKRDDDGNALTKRVPLIDEKFGDDLFDVAGIAEANRRRFDPAKTEYNADGKNRDKLGKFKTVADMVNEDWIFPEYEPQRPAGAYIVDTAPVNTMVLAITRGGKGQTYIEPMIDMWLRERRPNNMVINDPKGELLVKHYVRATMRGFQVVQFNLINPDKTDIYNPLGMAAEAAREGDSTKCAQYVENIADVFFPLDGGEDPMWPSAANNAFKRASYGLIDYYLEEERELRAYAMRVDMDPKVMESKLDVMWGRVTLYNCYQLFVQMASKKVKNPVKEFEERVKAKEFGDPQGEDFDEQAADEAKEEADRRVFMWEGAPELDMLTLYFNATSGLPRNSMRNLVGNADNALRAMGAAEKMLASVYGIAITAMSFFTDPTISTLTSGTPSQNTDFGGLSFPRRMGVRFSTNYLKRDHLVGMQAKWEAFEDSSFEKPLGADFEHQDIISRDGWARYYFFGKFATDVAYLRLRLVNPQTDMLVRTFHYRFTKDYQKTLNGRQYVTDPITEEKIVKNGLLIEVVKNEKTGVYEPGHTTFPKERLIDITMPMPEKEMTEVNTSIQTQVRYSESPKAVFLVTPPHLMKYAKLILILMKQLVDLNFDKSYMTKEDQKPLYKTRFMLDELGNLQSEGHGISGFETMLSIGLGQDQQFTIILQTLQQLREVYGDSVDKIVQGNTANIVYLKSTDDSMIETLEKMSGKRHVAYTDSKTVTKDMERVLKFGNVEGKVSYTMNTKEEPVISYNDMAFIESQNSIVFSAGNSPMWNQNEMALPMSWRLFQNTIQQPGKKYSLQTVPTLSTALDFDVRRNQPDFGEMLKKRMHQAELVEECREKYMTAYDYSDADVVRLDPDEYADDVMELVDSAMREGAAEAMGGDVSPDQIDPEELASMQAGMDFEDDIAQRELVAVQERKMEDFARKRYAGKRVSREMLVHPTSKDDEIHAGALRSPLDEEIVEAYKSARPHLERDADHFVVGGDGSLRGRDGSVYISRNDESAAMSTLKDSFEDESARVFSEDGDFEALQGFTVHPSFYEFLAEQETWQGLARGEFEKAMASAMRAND